MNNRFVLHNYYCSTHVCSAISFEIHEVKGQLHQFPLLIRDKGDKGPRSFPLLLDVGGGHHVVKEGEPRLLPHPLGHDTVGEVQGWWGEKGGGLRNRGWW